MDKFQLLIAHLSVGIIWIVVAIVLLVFSLRVRRILKVKSAESTIYSPILIAGYAFLATGLLHLFEEFFEFWEFDLLSLGVGLVNHGVVVALFLMIFFSIRKYERMLRRLTSE